MKGCTALMRRPCTALVRQPHRVSRLRRHLIGVRFQGHHFKEVLDWCCETCGLRHVPSPYEAAEALEPCPHPTLSRFEQMLVDYLLGGGVASEEES